jgi:hypothetical protein
VNESTRTERTLSAADGSTIAIVELEGSRPGPTLAVVAGVHGDEVACLGGLWDWLYGTDLLSGRVLAGYARRRKASFYRDASLVMRLARERWLPRSANKPAGLSRLWPPRSTGWWRST